MGEEIGLDDQYGVAFGGNAAAQLFRVCQAEGLGPALVGHRRQCAQQRQRLGRHGR